MRLFLLFSVFFSFILLDTLFSQDIEVTLSGSTSSQGFAVKNSNGNTLFRIRGDGTTGFGTAIPTGMFDILGGSTSLGNGKSINILAQSTNDPIGNGGDINLISGDSDGFGDGVSGDINILTNSSAPNTVFTGNINIKTGYADGIGGDINITAGGGQGSGGNVTLTTEQSEDKSGNIEILTGNGNTGLSGDIIVKTGYGSLGAGKISMSCGTAQNLIGSNIELNAGNADDTGGNILLIPGSGFSQNGLVIVNGSGTYSGSWTMASDERYKKNIEPLKNTLVKLEQLNGVSYELRREEFSKKNFSDGRQIGLIAQDVEKVYPELVVTDNEGYKSVAYQNIVAVLIEAVKEQQKSIDHLKKEVELLRSATGNNSVEVSSLGN